ncbi:uncharacterized protein LOC101858293 [Aplysia californica]|uniref:Uncharacterized protein LOC101858293 n=1 Tax=Aplysia californica TaxID=6500 RepID=A0ABM0JZ71_APLCA|nr:uncharacterized protein LOC101858293 [Aplysia californica]XP_005104990.1 uncharacterized protein LOC101858293 [Aplysia californica]
MSQNRKMCDPFLFLPTRISVIVLATFQGGILDYYLVKYNNHSWYAWIAGDVAIIFSFFVAFFISYRELKISARNSHLPTEQHKKTNLQVEARGFPLVYFAWLVYSVILAVRVALIYKNFAYKIESDIFFGTNMLKFTLAMAGVLFLLLVGAHHFAMLGTPARTHINLLTGIVPFDIIDCVDILSIFFNKDSKDAMEPVFEWTVIVIACINFLLPIIPLMMLSHSHFGVHPISQNMSTVRKLIQIFVVNTPLLSIRILMWHKQGEEVSPLIVKNIVMIMVLAMDLYEGEEAEKSAVVVDDEYDDRGVFRDDRRAENLNVLRYNNL